MIGSSLIPVSCGNGGRLRLWLTVTPAKRVLPGNQRGQRDLLGVANFRHLINVPRFSQRGLDDNLDRATWCRYLRFGVAGQRDIVRSGGFLHVRRGLPDEPGKSGSDFDAGNRLADATGVAHLAIHQDFDRQLLWIDLGCQRDRCRPDHVKLVLLHDNARKNRVVMFVGIAVGCKWARDFDTRCCRHREHRAQRTTARLRDRIHVPIGLNDRLDHQATLPSGLVDFEAAAEFHRILGWLSRQAVQLIQYVQRVGKARNRLCGRILAARERGDAH